METTSITPFTYNNHQIRTVTGPDGATWFVLSDLCKVLGLSNSSEVARRLDPVTLSITESQNARGQVRKTAITSEPGLYEVIFMSRKPEAQAFKRWVTREVLPSIRHTEGESHVTPDDMAMLSSPDFGDIRAVEQEGKVMFCGRDVANALGYKDAVNALKQHCRGVAFHHPIRDHIGRTQVARFITEGDLYRLIAHSRLPEAEKFEAWIFDEVIPSIRRRGGYLTPEATEKALMDPDFIIQLATSLKEERAAKAALEAQVAEDAPYTLFGRAASRHDTDLLVKDVAALITQAGTPIGSGTLFRWLRKHGWLCKRLGRMWNHPTQWAIDKGYIRARIHFVSTASGDMERVTPQVTVAGQQALIEGWATGEFFDDLTGADK